MVHLGLGLRMLGTGESVTLAESFQSLGVFGRAIMFTTFCLALFSTLESM